ncbi:MAG: enoyl-CoA hydratase/isomerase family protein [Christensenellaceae bacterium]|jgi:enoyl-CoA hydratase|nr:enoyl-CoA hydratase/isomerase family protein [Christensenellaceae bacterium]
MPEAIRVIKNAGIGELIFDKPENRNTMDEFFLESLLAGIDALDGDTQIRAIILKSTHPKVFLAGADIAYMVGNTPIKAKRFCDLGCAAFSRIHTCAKPVIAAINGHCLGGGLELALACDIRIASTNCKLGFPEVKLGISPGWGGLYRCARLIGEGRAKELLYTGKLIAAQEAERMGLINHAVEPEQLQATCEQLANEIAANAPIPVSLIKKWLPQAVDAADDVADHISGTLVAECFASEDQTEGMRAFLEKREAKFTGK